VKATFIFATLPVRRARPSLAAGAAAIAVEAAADATPPANTVRREKFRSVLAIAPFPSAADLTHAWACKSHRSQGAGEAKKDDQGGWFADERRYSSPERIFGTTS
jgi:hypothetical protein